MIPPWNQCNCCGYDIINTKWTSNHVQVGLIMSALKVEALAIRLSRLENNRTECNKGLEMLTSRRATGKCIKDDGVGRPRSIRAADIPRNHLTCLVCIRTINHVDVFLGQSVFLDLWLFVMY